MQKQQQFGLIAAVALGLAAVFMVNFYLTQQRQIVVEEAKKKVEDIAANLQTEQSNQTTVLVAKADITVGAVIEPDNLELKIVPSQQAQLGSVSATDRVVGLIAVISIPAGDQITLNKVSSRREVSASSLAMATPAGKRAITIPIDNISSLAGMIKPGNYVDVIVMVPLPAQSADGKAATQMAAVPVFQNVLILAVGQEIGTFVKDEKKESRYKKEEPQVVDTAPLVTLALTPPEASLMSFIQEQGKVRLILRSPADTQVAPPQIANWETLLRSIMPPQGGEGQEVKKGASIAPAVDKKMPQNQEGEVVPEPISKGPVKTVEIYRGLEKKVTNLSK